MITVSPQSPTSDHSIVITFQFGASCPEFHQTVVNGNYTLEVTNTAPGPCISAPVPLSHDWDIGRLDAGNYQATLIHVDGSTDVQSFAVTQGLSHSSIPTMGLAGAVVMVAAMAMLARLALRTR